MGKEEDGDSTFLPNLLVPRAEAERKIKEQIEKGREIRDLEINSEKGLGRLVLLCHLAFLDVILWITLVARLSKLALYQQAKIEFWATLAK